MEMLQKPETEVVEHGDHYTVFLPNKAGVAVFKRPSGLLYCENHKVSDCRDVQAVYRHLDPARGFHKVVRLTIPRKTRVACRCGAISEYACNRCGRGWCGDCAVTCPSVSVAELARP